MRNGLDTDSQSQNNDSISSVATATAAALHVLTTVDEPHVLRGYLKQKGVFSTYKKHFFSFNTDTGALNKYKKNMQESSDVIRVNDASLVQVMPGMNLSGKPNTIAIFRKNHSPMILWSESDAEYQIWLQALEMCNAGKTNIIGLLTSSYNSYNNNNNSNNNNNGNASPMMIENDSTEMDGLMEPTQNLTQKNKKSLLSALEAVLDCAVISDDRGTIVGFNKAAEQMFGWDRAEILGKNVKVLMPDYYAAYHDSFMTKYYHTGHKKLIGIPRNLIAKHKNESTFSLSLSLGEVTTQSQQSASSFGSFMGNNNNNNSGKGFGSTSSMMMNASRPSTGDIAFIALFRYATTNASKLADSSSSSLDTNNGDNKPRNNNNNNNKNADGTDGGGAYDSINHNQQQTLAQDLSEEFKNAREASMKSTRQLLKSYEQKIMNVYEDMQTKTTLMESKLEILEKENQRLTNRMRYQVEQEKLLQEELSVLQETPERIIMKRLLRHKEACRAFQKFCQTESKTIQNIIHFFRDADQFQNRFQHEGTCIEFNHLDDKTEMHVSAHQIYEKYIESRGIPISDPMELYFENHLATPTATMFGPLQTEVIDVLKGTLYKRFSESVEGKKALAMI